VRFSFAFIVACSKADVNVQNDPNEAKRSNGNAFVDSLETRALELSSFRAFDRAPLFARFAIYELFTQ